jgi:hypothetical protein
MRNLLTIAVIALTLVACDKDKETTETPVACDMAGMEMGGSEGGMDAGSEGGDMADADAGSEGGATDASSTEAGMEMDATVEAGSDMTDMGVEDMTVDAGSEGGVEETTDMDVEGGSADMAGAED